MNTDPHTHAFWPQWTEGLATCIDRDIDKGVWLHIAAPWARYVYVVASVYVSRPAWTDGGPTQPELDSHRPSSLKKIHNS